MNDLHEQLQEQVSSLIKSKGSDSFAKFAKEVIGSIHRLAKQYNIENMLTTSEPQSDSFNSKLITMSSEKRLLDVIKEELVDADEFYIASAFISPGPLNQLARSFEAFKHNGGKIKILTSIMNNFNHPDHLKTICEKDMELRVFYPNAENFTTVNEFKASKPPAFHIKCYIFKRKNSNHSIIVGSSNFTNGGMGNNHEWNYLSNYEINLPLLDNNSTIFFDGIMEFNRYWNENQSVELCEPFLEFYNEQYHRDRLLRSQINTLTDSVNKVRPEPRPVQVEALKRLENKRLAGVTRTAVIAATGLGKTFLSAFDFLASGFRNVLFIAHRETILSKTQETFNTVCGKEFKSVVLSGNSSDKDKISAYSNEESVFAMIQTLSKKATLKKFGRLDFDYIVVDEFHHAEAETYKKVLDHFKPKFFLGLTATPERMDGKDVLEYCNNDIAYEKRLFDAIESKWLCPFQYFAIHDSTDYSKVKWNGRKYDEVELEKSLSNDTRAGLIISNLKRYLPSSGKVKALAFCSNVGHAMFMTKQFNAAGISACYVVGTTPQRERDQLINDLQDESKSLQVICSVDVFSEGVDIPEVSHILLLRPTESFTVFLQQLGRGLRNTPSKSFCVILDFIGNFKKSYIAPLGLKGVTDITDTKSVKAPFKVPTNCYVDIDTEVQKIWNEELKRLVSPKNKKARLIAFYQEISEDLDYSPTLMDFFTHISKCDPSSFIKEFNGWLNTKKEMNDLTPYESTVIGTSGEDFLIHLEKGLNPSRSYKMVVLSYLVSSAPKKTSWTIDEITIGFKNFYLENLEYLVDFNDMYETDVPENYSLRKVKSHLIQNPLKFLSNKNDDCFVLDKERGVFKLKEEYHQFWLKSEFKKLVLDRVNYALSRYFYSKSFSIDYERLDAIRERMSVNEGFENLDAEIDNGIQVFPYSKVRGSEFNTHLPLVGQFAAGRPFRGFEVDSIYEQLDDLLWVEVPRQYCNEKSFVVRVVGDSMEPTIMKGDYVVCEYHRHRQPNHDIVIMGDFAYLSSGEEAIKRISELEDSWIFKSDNTKYDNIIIPKEEDAQYPILGTVMYNLTQYVRCR